MPQMSPMNWTLLLLMFSALLFFFIIMNFNNKMIPSPQINITLPSPHNNMMNWTW